MQINFVLLFVMYMTYDDINNSAWEYHRSVMAKDLPNILKMDKIRNKNQEPDLQLE